MSEAELRSRYVWDHPNFEQFQCDRLSPEQFHTHFQEMLRVTVPYDDFIRGWTAIYAELYSDVVDAITRLKPDVVAVAYTNTDPIHERIWIERYPELKGLFKRIYISSQLGFRKPERRGFEHILTEWKARPEQALFFDDDRLNVDAAKQLGMTAVLVKGPQDVRRSLMPFGLLR
jgi:putative hydrolase of the HAD superfamily